MSDEKKDNKLITAEVLRGLPKIEMEKLFVQQDPLTAGRVFEDEAIIITSGDGMSHSVNETGTFIWVRATGEKKAADIIKEICDEFDVEPEIAFDDCFKFILTGVEKRFLRVSREKFPPLPFDDD